MSKDDEELNNLLHKFNDSMRRSIHTFRCTKCRRLYRFTEDEVVNGIGKDYVEKGMPIRCIEDNEILENADF